MFDSGLFENTNETNGAIFIADHELNSALLIISILQKSRGCRVFELNVL